MSAHHQTTCFEDIFHAVPRAVPGIWSRFLDECSAHRIDAAWFLAQQNEVAVVGWCERQSRVAGFLYSRPPGGEFSMQEIASSFIGIPEPFESNMPYEMPASTDEMLRIARAQVAWGEKNHPDLAIGGRLIVGEVTKDGSTLTSAGALPRVQKVA